MFRAETVSYTSLFRSELRCGIQRVNDRMPNETSGNDAPDLTALLDIAREIGAVLDLDTLIRHIEEAALSTLDCERVTLFLFDAESNELWSRFATGTDEIRLPADQGIAGETLRGGVPINVRDAYADDRFNQEIDTATGFKTRNILSVPMFGHDGSPVGVLQVLNKKAGQFETSDEKLAVTFCSLTGVAVQRQRLLDEFAEKQKMIHDLEIAREIQESLLPEASPTIKGFDIAAWNRPADETGGDTYDFIDLQDGKWAIMLADATGHGIGPALIAAECRALLRALTAVTEDLVEVVTKANRILHRDLSDNRFVTVFFGILDPTTGGLNYISAGQTPLLYFRKSEDEGKIIGATTFPMGLMSEMSGVESQSIQLEAGDTFLLASDGYYEWMNSNEEEFGADRAIDLLRSTSSISADQVIVELNKAVKEFAGPVEQDDDLTAVVVRRR